MIKLTLTEIGTPKILKTVNGDKENTYVKAVEYGQNFLSWFTSEETRAITKDWKVGDLVEVENVEAKERNGKTYHNVYFRPKKADVNNQALERIENTLAKHGLLLERLINGLKDVHKATVVPSAPKIIGTDLDYPDEQIDPSDIPFD